MLSLYRACAWLHDLQYCFQLVAKQSVRKGRGASTRPARISDWSESMPPTAFGSVLAIGAIHRAVRAKARRTTKTSPWGPSVLAIGAIHTAHRAVRRKARRTTQKQLFFT